MKNMKLIITSDLHGFILPSDFTSRNSIVDLGLSRISTAIKAYRANKDDKVLLIDNGDAFQGSPLLSYSHKKQTANPMAEAFNLLNYDYINLGNHDFNYGPARLMDFIQANKAKLLTSNVYHNHKPIGHTVIEEVDGRKIALIGILTHYIPNWEKSEHIKDFSFKDAYTALEEEVKRLRDESDLIIAFYHGGFERDLKTNEATEMLTGENQGSMMSRISGLDALITGHQHRSILSYLGGVLVAQCADKSKEFIELNLDLKTLALSARLIASKDFPVDEDFARNFDALNAKTQDWLDERLGLIQEGDLLIHDPLDARIHKHRLVSFINQVILDYTKADYATNALFNEPIGFKQEISMRDLVNTYIYPNTLVIKKMSGQAILDFLEFNAEYFDLQDGRITFSYKYDKPKPQHYNYEMIDPLRYSIHVSRPIGSRITIKDPEFDLKKEYTVAMSNYRASGGGNFMAAKNAPTLSESSADILEILASYIEKNSPLVIDHNNNIKVSR